MDKSITAKKKTWRVNYVVTYYSNFFAQSYREPILAILKNVALLREIDCAIKLEYPFFDDEFLKTRKDLIAVKSDLVYFRSTPHTEISAKQFRSLIDHIFEQHQFCLEFPSVEVGPQMQKDLHLYPFPKL